MLLMVLVLGAPVITLRNDSNKELKSIAITGHGFAYRLESLKPNAEIALVVHPQGESGLQIEFTVDGHAKKKDDLAYLEASGGYCVAVRISETLDITSDIGALPIFCPRFERLIPF